jgi:hypothetical protein
MLAEMMNRPRPREYQEPTVVINADFDDPQPEQNRAAGAEPSQNSTNAEFKRRRDMKAEAKVFRRPSKTYLSNNMLSQQLIRK